MARYGISVADVNETIETALAGKEATTRRRGAAADRGRGPLPGEARADLDAVERSPVPGAGGERVPLAQIATIATVEGPAQISREKGMRRVVAEVNIRGRDLGGFVAEVQERLRRWRRNCRPATSWSTAASSKTSSAPCASSPSWFRSRSCSSWCCSTWRSAPSRDSLLVMLNLPFALVGGVVAVVVFGMPLSVSAAVAFIVLLGIAVQNGVVLIAFFRQLRDEGPIGRRDRPQRLRPAVPAAAHDGARSFIGHVPMLYATGSGADIQKPLAVVVMGGLVTSTLLTLIVLPTIYSMLAGRGASNGVLQKASNTS